MSPKVFYFLFSIFYFLFLSIASPIQAASPNVPLGSWVYPYIEKLSNLGYMESYIAGQLPLTRMEAALLIEQAEKKYKLEGKSSKIIPHLLNRLKREFREEMDILSGETDYLNYLKPAQSFYFEYPYLGGSMDMENEAGRLYGEDSNFQGGFIARGGLGSRFAFLVHPEFRQRNHLGFTADVIEAYGKSSLGPFEFEGGLDTMWWGQGRHGNLLLTNNAESFRMFKAGNSTPIILPWLFRYMGATKFSFFIAQLEENRPNPDPYYRKPNFWGAKCSIKPHPVFEWGGTLTCVTVDLWDTIFGLRGIHGGKANYHAGTDWNLRIPLKIQPITLYGEHCGGDSGWAHLFGLYLPRVLALDKIDLRLEYANTNMVENFSWYHHAASNEGLTYRYKGRLIGHHMGRDADDLFIDLTCHLSSNLKISFSFDRERHGIPYSVTEKKREYTFSIEYWLKNYMNWYGTFQWEDTDNQGFSLGNDEGTGYIRIGTAFYF